MQRSLRSSSFVGVLLSFVTLGLGTSPAHGQTVVYPAPVYTRPYVAYGSPAANAAVLPGFAPRGGIGTTPFLGNTRGLGAYSHNFDNDSRRAVYPYRTNNRRWFRRGR